MLNAYLRGSRTQHFQAREELKRPSTLGASTQAHIWYCVLCAVVNFAGCSADPSAEEKRKSTGNCGLKAFALLICVISSSDSSTSTAPGMALTCSTVCTPTIGKTYVDCAYRYASATAWKVQLRASAILSIASQTCASSSDCV